MNEINEVIENGNDFEIFDECEFAEKSLMLFKGLVQNFQELFQNSINVE